MPDVTDVVEAGATDSSQRMVAVHHMRHEQPTELTERQILRVVRQGKGDPQQCLVIQHAGTHVTVRWIPDGQVDEGELVGEPGEYRGELTVGIPTARVMFVGWPWKRESPSRS